MDSEIYYNHSFDERNHEVEVLGQRKGIGSKTSGDARVKLPGVPSTVGPRAVFLAG